MLKKTISHLREKYRIRAYIDLVLMLIILIVSTALFVHLDIKELMQIHLALLEPWELDEFLLVLAVLGVLASFFAFRRWIDLRKEVAIRQRFEEQLTEANQLLEEHTNSLEQRNQEIELIGLLSSRLQVCHSQQEVLMVVNSSLGALFPGIKGCVWTTSISFDGLECLATWGGYLPHQNTLFREDCWVMRLRLPFQSDSNMDCRCCQCGPNGQVVSCFPMIMNGEVLGAFTLFFPEASFRKEIRRNFENLAVSVADQISLALSNVRLQETLRSYALRDPLTGLFNRRYLEVSIEQEIRRSLRKELPFCVLMMDVDHFKQFNDSFGHEAGDLVLQEISYYLQRFTRAEDVVCRYGGEEFLIIMPETEAEEALFSIDELRAGIERLDLNYQGQDLGSVTLSVGVSWFPDHGVQAEELIRAADGALYRAKQEGRNRVVLA